MKNTKQNAAKKVSEAPEDDLRWWMASPQRPVYLYYCKANIKTGDTVVVMQNNKKVFCKGIVFSSCCGEFKHQNAIGKAKKSGANNILKINTGQVYQTE